MLKKRMRNKSILQSTLQKTKVILLAVFVGTLLSSCLVEKKDPVTIARTTDTLRIYQPGDFIEYNVSAVITSPAFATKFGTLRVQWDSNIDLTDPITTTIKYPVLKETTTLTYDGETSPDSVVIRYISQVKTAPVSMTDPGIGSIILHAIDDGTDLYWPYDTNIGTSPENSSSPVIAPVLFDSPMAVGTPPLSSPLGFSVMEGCGIGLCGTRIYDFSDTFTINGDTTSVVTNLGTFTNPFQISFSGGTIPKDSLAIFVLGDFRDSCGARGDTITHEGSMFVLPELGIIKITDLCQVIAGTTGDVAYTITVRSTNIPLP